MRIISGTLKGRIFQSPKKFATHPMSEKIRGALFNTLGDISGMTVLDAYGGSGAVGFEALSRGAIRVVTCDIDKDAIRTIKETAKTLGVEKSTTIVHANCVSYLANQLQRFDIVICDPPYNDVKTSQLQILSGYVRRGGLLVLSLPPAAGEHVFNGFELLQAKDYGDASLWYYRAT